MGKFLSYDNFLNQALRKLADCFCLSLLWVLCCIPVVTVGAASTALYYTVHKAVRFNRGGIWQEYWRSFRQNFKQATLVWIILLLVYCLLIAGCYSAYLLYLAGSIPRAVLIFLLVLAALVTMWASYLFPHIARFQCRTKQLLKNCELMALLNFFRSILLLVLLAIAVLALLYIPLALLFVPAVYMWAGSYILERVFRKYMLVEDLEAEDMLNANADI